MIKAIKNSSAAKFAQGFHYPFSSLRFIHNHPGLYRFVVIPFTVNVTVFSLVLYFGVGFFWDIIGAQLPQVDAWYWIVLSYVLFALALMLIFVMVFFSFTVVGCIIASPFNDLLSEKTEGILSGEKVEEVFSLTLLAKDVWQTLVLEAKKISFYVGGMLFFLFLNLLPGIGSMLYFVCSSLWTIFFLIVEFTGYVFSRKGMSFSEQRRVIMSRLPLMFGFGTGVFTILAIPLMQLLCIPLGVVGATKLLHDFDLIPQSRKPKT